MKRYQAQLKWATDRDRDLTRDQYDEGDGPKVVSWIGAAALLLLAACAPVQWTKPGGTPEQFARDSYECERDMRQSFHANRWAAADFRDRCMEAKGYSKVSE